MNSSSRSPRKNDSLSTGSNDGDARPSPRRSPNKIYRTPPTPPPEALYKLEKSFTLDCIAVNTTSNEYSKARPKLGQVIRPYNSQKDPGAKPYFRFAGVENTLRLTGQNDPKFGSSVESPVIDRFFESGAGYQYLLLRNKYGAGHSGETIDGHSQFMTNMKPIIGYNGRFGYRRNLPSLRQVPSTFGTATTSPLY